jgi:hypothetical protein
MRGTAAEATRTYHLAEERKGYHPYYRLPVQCNPYGASHVMAGSSATRPRTQKGSLMNLLGVHEAIETRQILLFCRQGMLLTS